VNDEHDAQVKYTVKELLAHIKDEQTAGFARIETSLSMKADKADVERLEKQLDSHAGRIESLERSRDQSETAAKIHAVRDDEFWTFKRRTVGVILTMLTALATFVGPWLATHVG
jgi:hypothetical protein